MGFSLEEYAARHPQATPPAVEAQAAATAALSYRERLEEQAETERLKTAISRGLEQGSAPQFILYAALQAIGLLTHDKQWEQENCNLLDTCYAGLEQQSLLANTAAAEAERLEQMQAKYLDRIRKQLQANLSSCKKLEQELQKALAAANGFTE